MMPSYFTPPSSASSHWSQPMFPRPPSATYQQNAPLQQQPSPVANQSPFASAVMQQLSYNTSHQQHQYPLAQQQQHVQTPAFGQPRPEHNALLAQVLYEQTRRGLTYKAALESLHGHQNILAYAWKDYFLENKETIDALVDQLRGRTPSTSNVPTIQPSPSPIMKNGSRHSPDTEREQSRSHSLSEPPNESRASGERSASVSKKGKSKEATPIRSVRIKKEKAANGKSKHKAKEKKGDSSSRRTLNSLSSAPSNDLLAKVPPAVAIDTYTGLPAAPSRSPSPPPLAPNSRYTEQDAIFFFRRIAYDLARDPDLSKARLCELLGEKAPHHSAVSWRSYWHKHEDVVDKMYLLTQLDEEDRENAIQSWKGKTSISAGNASSRPAARRVSYKESSDSDLSEADSDSESSSSNSEDESSSDGEDDDDALGSTDEEDQLGESGSAFKTAEKRVLAKHIASVPDWFKGQREWETFFSAYPQRTPAAWREFYRRKADEVDALAQKFIRKAKKASGNSISAQRGRPSWARPNASSASNSTADGTGPIKRKLWEEESREQSEEKRSKMEDVY